MVASPYDLLSSRKIQKGLEKLILDLKRACRAYRQLLRPRGRHVSDKEGATSMLLWTQLPSDHLFQSRQVWAGAL